MGKKKNRFRKLTKKEEEDFGRFKYRSSFLREGGARKMDEQELCEAVGRSRILAGPAHAPSQQ